MQELPKAIYQTPAQIGERILQLEINIMRLGADTDEHRKVMREISRLRVYADAKRWLAGPVKQRA